MLLTSIITAVLAFARVIAMQTTVTTWHTSWTAGPLAEVWPGSYRSARYDRDGLREGLSACRRCEGGERVNGVEE